MRPSLRTLIGKKNLVGCEIGVSWGENAKEMLDGLDIMKLYLVDPLWKVPSELKKAERTLAEYLDKIVWIGKESQIVTSVEIPTLSLDFVYIDGDHHYWPFMRDLIMYWRKVKIGGLFAGHDFRLATDVPKAVLKFCRETGLQFHCEDQDWWVYKV